MAAGVPNWNGPFADAFPDCYSDYYICGLDTRGAVKCWWKSPNGCPNLDHAGPFTQITADSYMLCGIYSSKSASLPCLLRS